MNIRNKYIKWTLLLLLINPVLLLAQTKESVSKQWKSRLPIGFNVGGTSPMGLPKEVRSVDKYRPMINIAFGADLTYYHNLSWGVRAGIRYEQKGMLTQTNVKHYSIAMNVNSGDEVGILEGIFTGDIETQVKLNYLTLPIQCIYNNGRWEWGAGIYIAALMNGEFYGKAQDGYIRKTPIDARIGVQQASYDFSHAIHKIDIGIELSMSYLILNNISMNATLNGGFFPVLKQAETPLDFNLYNINMNIGLAYHF